MATQLTWTVHPARQRPADAALAAAIISFAAWAVLVGLQSLLLTGLAIVILLLATAAFWLPTTYILDENGVAEQRLGRQRMRAWSELRRYTVGSRGALLSPFARSHWLDRYRGVVLLFGDQAPAPVKALLAEKIGEAQRG
jgi:hypothetical protein